MGRTRAAVAQPQPERSPRWWLAWAVPAAAAATAVAIWVAVPRPTNVAVIPSSTSSLQKEAPPASTPPPAAPAQAEPAAPPATAATRTLQDRAQEAAGAQRNAIGELKSDAAQQAPGNVVESVPVAPAASAERREEAERQSAVTGQLQTRAAFANNVCGPMWPAPPSDVAGQITAGSSPSAAVCWIVGRGGAVLRSTDQRTWQRLNFSVTVDLTSVKATDAQSATVVTSDGRTFSTVDGGVTWSQPQ